MGQGFYGNRRLDDGQSIAKAEVNATAEGNVGAGILAVDVESFRIVEQRLVVISGAEGEENLGARRGFVSSQFGVLSRDPPPTGLW